MITLREITKVNEVLPYVWNIVFKLEDYDFEYTTDLLYLHNTNSWVVSKRIPHELTSMLQFQTCPLCKHNGISCSQATTDVKDIVKQVLENHMFHEATSKRFSNLTEETYKQYQFVNNKTEWSKLYEENKL